MQSFNQYERLTKVKQLLDSDINSITDQREESLVFQPKIQDGFSTKSGPHTPQNKRVGVDERDKLELPNNFPKITGQIIEHRTDWNTPHGKITWVVPEIFLNEKIE